MFNILLCDAELRLYELESLRVGLNLAKFGTRKTLESHSKSIMQMDRSHQSTLLPLCYMILYIRYMLSPECLSAYCLLLWSTAGHAASGTAISSYKQVEGLQDINQSVEILVRLLSAVPGWSEKMFSNRDGMNEMQQLETWLQVPGVGVPPKDWNTIRGSAN
ncbi:hypothetical protein PS2_030316 [Malus domestica]